MSFVSKKIKSIAVVSSILFFVNSCGKDPSDLNPKKYNPLEGQQPGGTWERGGENEDNGIGQSGDKSPESSPKKEREETNNEYNVDLFISNVEEKIVIDTDQFLKKEYFPIDTEFSEKSDNTAVIHNAGDVSWYIGGGTLNRACEKFANSKKYDLYEVVNEHKIKKQNLNFTCVLSEEELEKLEYDKKIQTQYCDLFLSSENKLGCKLLLLSNESIAKDRNNYNFMLYQVGPNNFTIENKDMFFRALTQSNESYYRVIAKNKELLKGRTIYYSGVSNCGYASGLRVKLYEGDTAVENIINAFSLKKFIDNNPDFGIKIVLNRDTSLAYSFIKDKTDSAIEALVNSAEQKAK